jgi:7,8-dihydropterin-6-yl-methyl-4-(beta-D-ribofuranosyl)aminobenzene 5'-phosphate synthase
LEPIFFLDWVSEQALAINVKGKGIVVIIGCGHQTLERIHSHVEALFDEPFWGFIGGLHYPVTDSRVIQLGIKRQRYVGSGKPPWDPPTIDDIRGNIEKLRKRNPKLV